SCLCGSEENSFHLNLLFLKSKYPKSALNPFFELKAQAFDLTVTKNTPKKKGQNQGTVAVWLKP
ncbi:MAG: hypothetical protein KDK04_24075, partial [Candidatus Competibacteraceae bacterium]|nr:hypothetical protein [Candidatus Competibacteraceae bacterium]